jgi:hypothetical protein
VTTGRQALAQRGAKRHAATEQALRQAWERLRTGAPTHPDLVGGDWQLSVSVGCLEAGCSRNALYAGHTELLTEIRSHVRRLRRTEAQTEQNQKRSRLETYLAACRADRQRLISENAALLLRALTAEDALARLKRHPVRPLKMTDDTPRRHKWWSSPSPCVRARTSLGACLSPAMPITRSRSCVVALP